MALTPFETVDAIVSTNREIASFWSYARGWAPLEAAELLSKSRLDWQVELSEMLHTWIAVPESSTANGHLILGYANLGALVEGSLKWFLSVHYNDYKSDVDALKDKHGDIVSPDGQTLEPLRQFYRKRIWDAADPWFDWVLRIQQRRNAIHAFKNRNLGTHPEFLDDVSVYFDLLSELNGCVPYPDFS